MEHHADFAVPVTQRLVIETSHPRPNGDGAISGRALALGWWVDPGGPPAGEEPAGTLYLVADTTLPHPVWVRQANVTAFRLED